MTIFLDAAGLANLTTYAGLVSTVQLYVARSDLVDRIPDFIRMAEARFRRVLTNIDREMEATIAVNTTDGIVSLPDYFDSARSLYMTDPYYHVFGQVSPAAFHERKRHEWEVPIFVIEGNSLIIAPIPETTYSATLLYKGGIPPLADVDTNWLYAQNPDVYLYATLREAEFFGWNDDRLPLIESAVSNTLGEIQQAALRKRYGSAQLVAQPAVRERLYGTIIR